MTTSSELAERLLEMAGQKLSHELTVDEYRAADFEEAWDTLVRKVRDAAALARTAQPTAHVGWKPGPEWSFAIGDRVTKLRGSSWTGRVVGFYSTALTPRGYCVESDTEKGSVQIYPEAALATRKEAGEDDPDTAFSRQIIADFRKVFPRVAAEPSSNYVANSEIYPTRVTFANGRVVSVTPQGHLEIGWVAPEGAAALASTDKTTFGPRFFDDVGRDPDKWVAALRVRLGTDALSYQVLRDFFAAALTAKEADHE